MNPSKHVKSLIDAVKKIEKAIDKQNMCINETDCYVKYCKNIQSQITKLINSGNNTKLVALLNSRLKFMNIRFIHKLQERRRRQQLQNEQPSNEIRIIENSKISELASDNNCVVNDVEDNQAGMNNEISELDNDNSNCAVIGHGIEDDGQTDDQIDNIGSIQQQQHEPLEWRDSMSAFATSIKEGIIDNTTYKDVRLFLKECLEVLKPVIQGLLKKNNLKALANILSLNKLSNNGYPEVVKAINLEENVNHKISNLKIVDTKYGQKIVIDLSYNDKDDVCFYLSSKMGNALLKDVESLNHTNKYANEVYIMSFYVLDVIGFVDNTNALVAKELALMPTTYNEDIKTWFFKAPYEWEQLNEKSKKYNEYIVYRDGLEWESGALDYDCVKEVLNKHLMDAKTIFVRHFKVRDWLASYGFKNFCDVSQDPDYNDYNIPICKMTPCLKHTHSILMSCATRNVKKILFNVMLHCQ
uniref:Uncharacterized protein n=1 Tax=Trichogramma kaykai TaxID=54128 RepID=A0ABD2WYY4_9HYME